METSIIKISNKNIEKKALISAKQILLNGGIIVFPTDTVYGLAAYAFNYEAQKKIYSLKGRNYRKPLTIMVNNIQSISIFAEVSKDAIKLMKRYWPGPLTIVLPATDFGKISMGGRTTVGIRIPNNTLVQRLLDICGFPIATTSANPSSKPSAKTGSEAIKYFKDKVDLIIDAGKCRLGLESTVIDMVRFPYVVIREGYIPKKELLLHI